MFVLMGLSAVFPVFHGLKMHGLEETQDRIGLTWLVLQGFFYILGAGLYAVSCSLPEMKSEMLMVSKARWPERSWPGSFDIWGSSHQIFHVLVVMAAASHLYGLLKAFDFHHGAPGVTC